MHDVYAYGMLAPSTLWLIDDAFPSPGGYAEIAEVHHSLGGEAAGGAYVLARLGISVGLDGNWLGDNDDARRVLDLLKSQGVDCSLITVKNDCQDVREMVIADRDSRTIFGTYRKLQASGIQWNEPSAEAIHASRIVCLDPFFGEQSKKAAELCVSSGVPYVIVDVKPDSEVSRNAAVRIISEEFILRELPNLTKEDVFLRYARDGKGLTILTYGAGEILYGRTAATVSSFRPFIVHAIDTTGAGDSFRAGIIFAILNGKDDREMIRSACAVSALVCRTFPGVLKSPLKSEVEAFLSSNE